MAVRQVFRQTQLLFLTANYCLVCWLIAQLEEEGYLGLFIFLLVILSIERILITIKQIFMLLFGMEYCTFAVSFISNCFFLDLSLGYDIDEDDWCFFNNQFSRQINYTVHYLNQIPLIICFAVSNLRQDVSSFSHPVYWILIIYGLILVSAVELTLIIQKRNDNFNLFQCIWRFIEGICRFGFFCACVGELLSVSLWFLWLAVLVVSFEILVKSYLSNSCYFFSTFFQIQLLSSYESIKNYHKNAEFYLITNAFQAVFLSLLFIIRTSIHPDFKTYDILLYVDYAIIIPSGLSSIYYLYIFMKFGPFSSIFYLNQKGIDPKQQMYNLLVDKQKILIATENHTLTNHVTIYITQFNEQIFSKQQQNLFDFEILNAVANRKTQLSSCIVNNKNKTDFYVRDNNVQFKFDDPLDTEKVQNIITLILDSELLKTQKMRFTLDASSMIKYELTRIFLQKTYFANPKIVQITPGLQVDYHKKLFLDMLKFIANSKVIFPLLPINQGACMFDLYEDYLSASDL